MTATAEKVLRHGPYGIPLHGTCAVCGGRFRQPGNGRPRVLCRKRRCALERHNKQRRQYEGRGARLWTDADRAEALSLWHDLCAVCRNVRPDRIMLGTELLWVCFGCRDSDLTPRADAWLSLCRPGCPLPNPFAGGAK